MFELVPSLYMRSLFEELGFELTDFNKAAIPVASVHYTAEGVIQRIWSNEMSKEDEDKVDSYRRERFESQFINIPFEGTVGFPVRDIRDGMVGVL